MSKHLHFYEIVAGADNSRAMESDTIQKNGASPKSHTSRGNFLKLVVLLFVLCAATAFSQAPPNDLCVDALQLDCNGYYDGTTVGATCKGAPVSQYASCYGVWYKIDGDGNQATIKTNSPSSFYHKMVIFSGTCTGLIHEATASISGGAYNITHTINLTLGTTYYVYIAYGLTSGGITNVGDFVISRTCTPKPTNDICATATDLECNITLDGTTAGTTLKGAPVTQYVSGYGVWYKIDGDGNQATIKTNSPSSFYHKMVIFSGTCTGLIHEATASISGGAYNITHTINLTLGTTYYVYIAYGLTSGNITNVGDFVISRECECTTWSIGDPGYNSNVIAKLCGNTLTISGNGNMCDFWHSLGGEAPWYNQRNEIHNVVIENGVLNIGECAFEDCSNLQKVTIPNSVIKINDRAFYNCCNLAEIHIQNLIPPIIYEDTFGGCGKSIPNCKLYIPDCSAADAYSIDWGWPLTNIYKEGSTEPCKVGGIDNYIANQLKIFPNPAQTEIFIKSDLQIEKVEIYSITGSLLDVEDNFTEKISVSTLPQGVYLLKVFTSNGVVFGKFVKD